MKNTDGSRNAPRAITDDRDRKAARRLSERVRLQLYGPARGIGPFPQDCRALSSALDDQPPGDFQLRLHDALVRHLSVFSFEMKLADGVAHFIRLSKSDVDELCHRRVIEYLSRLLLSYVRDRDRIFKRPDLVSAANDSMAQTLREFSEEARRHGFESQALGNEQLAAQLEESAQSFRRRRPRDRPGRTSGLPPDSVLVAELAGMRRWVRSHWQAIRTTRRPAEFARESLASLCQIVATSRLDIDSLQSTLFPPKPRRKTDALVIDLMALAYGVHRRTVLYAKKRAEANR